jgi:hypothetical protein
LEAAIFIFYLLLFIFFVAKFSFLKKAGIERPKLIGLFLIKIIAGVAYALFYKLPKYYDGSDTWRFYRLSLKEKQWLLSDPIGFIKDLFVYGYDRPGGLFAGENSYWNDLKSNIPIKMMACMNVITGNSYYTNIILFNFIFLIGLVALFKVFLQIFPRKKNFIIIGVFLLPSTLFWCSGIHKDGLILSALGVIVYSFNKLLNQKKITATHLGIILFSMFIIFTLRNYIAIALVPALFCWWIAYKHPNKGVLAFSGVYFAGLILFFSIKFLSPQLDLPKYLSEKQNEFSRLEGTSTVVKDTLQPTLASYVKYFPKAVDMAFFRPHVAEAKSLSYIPAAAENTLLLLLLLLLLLSIKSLDNPSPFLLFCIFFSLSILFVCGYTITLSGAIVRYRSLMLPYLITLLLCSINFKYLRLSYINKN